MHSDLEQVRAAMARHNFERWLKLSSPGWNWDWRHLKLLRTYLDRVTSGEIKRLAISMPPQHGKSEMTTVRYPVWRLLKQPGLRVAVTAYSGDHANRFSRRARRIAYKMPIEFDDRGAVSEWETTAGGGYRAVGVGGGITGNPVDLLLIDDPIKSREDAESDSYRRKLKEWYTDDLYTRLQPGAAVIIIQTRWHEDDLIGWILENDAVGAWTALNLPALAEEKDDMLGREIGEALCPDRFTREDLLDFKRVLGTSFEGLYQGRPVAKGGNIVRRAWLEPLVMVCPRDAKRVRYWDKAATQGDGDYSSGVLIARDANGVFYIEDVVRGQWSARERNKIMIATAERDADMYGVGAVQVWAEQEGGSGGKESAELTIQLLAGHDVHVEIASGSKTVRFQPFAAQAEAGNVKVLRRHWSEEYIREIIVFPSGKHDDQADATSGAINKLCLIPQAQPMPQGTTEQLALGARAPEGVFMS